LAVGGTSLSLNADNSYNSESGWGYYSTSTGTFIGSGGGLSQYESEPAYQQRVQSTGSRTTPDVSFVADPATGAWIADPYNLDPSNPWEVVGGTSLSAPCWAGLIALVNQGRSAAGQPALNSASPTETQQSLYTLSQNDYHVIATGSNGYSAAAGYNLVTGLGTPVANLLVPDLVAGNSPSTGQVPAASAAALVNSANTGANTGGAANVMNAFNVFAAVVDGGASVGSDQATVGGGEWTADSGSGWDAGSDSSARGATPAQAAAAQDLPAAADGTDLAESYNCRDAVFAGSGGALERVGLAESLRDGRAQESIATVHGVDLGNSVAASLWVDTPAATRKSGDADVDRVFAELGQDGSTGSADGWLNSAFRAIRAKRHG
jgi:hypothetical protein